MTIVVWTTWAIACAATALPLALRVTGADQRWLPAIRLAGLGLAPSTAAVVAFVLADLAQSPGGMQPPPPDWMALVPVALLGLLALLVWPPRSRRAVATGPELTVVTVNVERDTPTADRIARRVLDLDADLVLVQEYTPATATAWARAGALAAYPHRVEDPDDGWFGSLILSRFPIEAHMPATIGERRSVVATVLVDGRRVVVVPVHLQAPIHTHDADPWRTGFTDLGSLAQSAAADGRLVLLAGDWNAVLTHAPMRALLQDHDLTDAHRSAGRVRPRTWPVGRTYPPLLCLDHVVVSRDVDVFSVREEPMPGTDHHAVVAHLQLP